MYGKKRMAIWLTVILVAMLLLSGSAFAQRPITLEVWGLDPNDVGQGAAIEAWNAANPTIQVRSIAAGERVQDPQRLLTAIVAGSPPDVAWVDRFQIASWVSRDAFMSVDEFIDRDGLTLEDQFYQPAIDEVTFEGHVWALPTTIDSRALYVNLDLLAEAGLDVNDLHTGNWEQLREWAIELTKKGSDGRIEQIGFVPTQDPWTLGSGGMWVWGWANGGRELSEDGLTVTLNNPQFVEALEWAVNIIDSSGGMIALSDFASGYSAGTAQEGFLQGVIAIRLNHNAFLRDISRFAPELNFVVLPINYRDSQNPMSFGGGHSLVIPRGAQHAEQAWEFMKWFAGPDASQIQAQAWKDYFEEQGRTWIPTFYADRVANASILDSLYEPEDEHWREYTGLFERLLEVNMFRAQSPIAQQIHRTFLFEAQQEAQYHEKTSQQALDDATQKLQQELDEYLRQTN